MAARKRAKRQRGRKAAGRGAARPRARRKIAAPRRRRGQAAARRTATRRKPARRAAARAAGGRRRAPKPTLKRSMKRPAKRHAKRSMKRSPKRSTARARPVATARGTRTAVPRATPAPVPEVVKSVRSTPSAPAVARARAPMGAGRTARAARLDRERRLLSDPERMEAPKVDRDERLLAAARTGHDELRESLRQHTETGPELTGGDIDAKWEDAYAVGDEAPGGDNPTPDQDRVDDIGRSLGVTYEDNEELKGAEKIIERDKKRWEFDPASSDDWPRKE